MQRVIVPFVVLWCVLLLGVAHAEVITIEGTIKSVDAAKRTITVETEGEKKTLDVSSKVKISNDGKESALDSLKPGQNVKLSYHDELEIVLKIEGIPVVQNDSLVGATLYQGHHYKVFHEAGLDWKTAKTRCEAMGGHLVTINNERENKFMIALATKTIGDINNSGIWLGATDERNEGQWEWLDGAPFTYSNWNEGQPNGNLNENYLLLLLYFRGPAGKEFRGWCDQPMAGKVHVIYYACEWDSIENPRKPDVSPAAGWVKLFNGKDLEGWKGLVADPKKRAAMKPEELAEAQKKADANMKEHWSVVDGELVFDGKGNSLCTIKDYGDFEFYVDWKILEGADSGIYLRGSPQVQIWDTKFEKYQSLGADKGSGALWNNQTHPRFPLVLADNPVGEWNTFFIRMVGEKVTIKLNDKLVTDDVVMENYWDRKNPIYPRGQIELQNHGSTLWFRNVYIRELDVK